MKYNDLSMAKRLVIWITFFLFVIFWFFGLAVGFLAVFGKNFLYGGLIIEWFPYNFDQFEGLLLFPLSAALRFLAGATPVIVASLALEPFYNYLTMGKDWSNEMQRYLAGLATWRSVGIIYGLISTMILVALLMNDITDWWVTYAGIVTAPGALLLLPLWFSHLNAQCNNINRKLEKSTISTIDEIVSGKNYKGSLSSVFHTKVSKEEIPFSSPLLHFTQLCKTQSAQWFILEFQSRNGSGIALNIRVTPVDESGARSFVEKEPEVYKRIFGEAEIA